MQKVGKMVGVLLKVARRIHFRNIVLSVGYAYLLSGALLYLFLMLGDIGLLLYSQKGVLLMALHRGAAFIGMLILLYVAFYWAFSGRCLYVQPRKKTSKGVLELPKGERIPVMVIESERSFVNWQEKGYEIYVMRCSEPCGVARKKT